MPVFDKSTQKMEEYNISKLPPISELKPGLVTQVFIPIEVPVGQPVAPTLVQAVNAASHQIIPGLEKIHPDRRFFVVTRQVVVLDGKLMQNLLLLVDIMVE